jgi:tRNA(fMet)-specific endonuclease VapC
MVGLDTDHMSLLEWSDARGSTPLRTRLASLPPAEVATTIISYEEQMHGWMAYIARTRSMTQQVEAYRRLRRQLENYCRTPVLPFEEQAAVTLQRLRRARIRIGTMDLKIAAIALSHDATLLSRNLADFRQVPDCRSRTGPRDGGVLEGSRT